MRQDQPEEQPGAVVCRQQAPRDPDVERVAEQHVQHGDPEQHSEQDRLRSDIGVVGEDAGREVLGRRGAVVLLEVDLDQLPHLLRRRDRQLGRWAAGDEDTDAHRDDQEEHRGADPPVAGAIADRREVDLEEPRDVGPGRPATTCDDRSGPRDQR